MMLSNVKCIELNIIQCCQKGGKFCSRFGVIKSYSFLKRLCISHAFVR